MSPNLRNKINSSRGPDGFFSCKVCHKKLFTVVGLKLHETVHELGSDTQSKEQNKEKEQSEDEHQSMDEEQSKDEHQSKEKEQSRDKKQSKDKKQSYDEHQRIDEEHNKDEQQSKDKKQSSVEHQRIDEEQSKDKEEHEDERQSDEKKQSKYSTRSFGALKFETFQITQSEFERNYPEKEEIETKQTSIKPEVKYKIEQKARQQVKQVKHHSCPKCDKYFSGGASLRRHVSSIHEKLKFKCQHCDKSFTQPTWLRYHTESAHLNFRRHTCQICSRSFSSKFLLKKHKTCIQAKK